jgi:hypothetical protein
MQDALACVSNQQHAEVADRSRDIMTHIAANGTLGTLGKSVLPDGLVPSVAKFGWLEVQTSSGGRPQVGLVPPEAKFLLLGFS